MTSRRKFLILLSVSCLAVLYVGVWGGYQALVFIGEEPWSWRKARFKRAAERAETLINAIERYERERGEPPASLEALVPQYLPKIPGTGLLGYPDFIYTRTSYAPFPVVWYDLGPRNGRTAEGNSILPCGDPARGVLGLMIGQEGTLRTARHERTAKLDSTAKFDPQRWRAREGRTDMLSDLFKKSLNPGMHTNDIFALLGPPDGKIDFRYTPWELKVKCFQGSLDVFVYWPSQRYPEYFYGGSGERIEKWVYVHE